MARKKPRQKRHDRSSVYMPILGSVFLLLTITLMSAYQHILATNEPLPPIPVTVDPNIGLQLQVEEFFLDNEAPEMIPIIACESNFRHYQPDGSILKNTSGSSATGIAQILSSVHPDPKIVYRYNQRYQTDLAVEDIDITTVEGNLGYALMLYTINGTRDWECA